MYNIFYDFFFQPIDYTSERGVSVVTNKAETTVSSLIIPNAQIQDSGVYSCQNGQVDPVHVNVQDRAVPGVQVLHGVRHKQGARRGLLLHLGIKMRSLVQRG